MHQRSAFISLCWTFAAVVILTSLLVMGLWNTHALHAAGGNTLALPNASVAPGQTVTVTLAFTQDASSAAAYSVDLRVTYDPAVVNAISVQKGSATASSAWLISSNLSPPGLIRVGLATGSAPLTIGGELIRVTFQAAAQADETDLTIQQGSLNEGAVAATLQHGHITVNTPPVATDDAYGVDEDNVLTVNAAAGVRANDADADLHVLTVALASGPSHGALNLHVDGSFVYTPTHDYFGPDEFTYTVSDGHGGVDTSVAALTVNPVNDAPTANAGGPYNVVEGGSVALSGAQGSDVDDATNTLIFEWDLNNDSVFETTGASPTFSVVGRDGPTSATVSLRVKDSHGGVSSVVTATVTINNGAPTANPGGPYNVVADGSVQLNGSGSSDPAGVADPMTYEWDLNDDGVFETAGSTPTFDATGLADVAVTIRLRVRDDEGAVSAVATTTVVVGAVPRFNIDGAVHFWHDNRPVPNALLTLAGAQPMSATTNASGAYTLPNVLRKSYTLSASKTDQSEGITAFDAALVLRHVSGDSLLTGHAVTAADVNGVNGVSSLDASLILQETVGLIGLPFQGAAGVWVFAPASYNYAPLNAQQTGQDFTAVLIGDASGNWGAATARAGAAYAAGPPFLIEQRAAPEDNRIAVTIRMNRDVSRLYALEFHVLYDSSQAVFEKGGVAPSLRNWAAATNGAIPGQVAIALAGTTVVRAGDELATLSFTPKAGVAKLDVATVLLRLNEIAEAGQLPNGPIQRVYLPMIGAQSEQ